MVQWVAMRSRCTSFNTDTQLPFITLYYSNLLKTTKTIMTITDTARAFLGSSSVFYMYIKSTILKIHVHYQGFPQSMLSELNST